jgi:hypothetical protein
VYADYEAINSTAGVTHATPALAHDAQVALTLRALGGLQTEEIARAFLVPEQTMAKRLVRAKQKIRPAFPSGCLHHTCSRIGSPQCSPSST